MHLVNGTIILRAIEKEDNHILKELINNPEVEAKVGGWSFPSSDEKQMQWYQQIVNDNSLRQVRYAVEADGACVGMAALHGIDYKNSNAGVDIKLISSARGKGIGKKVIELLIKYSFEELNLHCLEAEILEENNSSRKLFERCGFQLEGVMRKRIYKGGKYHNQCVYSILKDEYKKD